MDSYSNLFHFIRLSQQNPARENRKFLPRYLEQRHRRALFRTVQKTGVVALVSRLNPHPATGIVVPHAEDKALSAAITTAAITWCKSYGKIMHLIESMTNNVVILHPVQWRRIPPEGMTPGTAQSRHTCLGTPHGVYTHTLTAVRTCLRFVSRSIHSSSHWVQNYPIV